MFLDLKKTANGKEQEDSNQTSSHAFRFIANSQKSKSNNNRNMSIKKP